MRGMNDWITFNSIIYRIYTVSDNRKMRAEVLEQLKMLIDFDAADFYLAKRDGSAGLENPTLYNCGSAHADCYDDLDYSRGILYSGTCIAYRETDIIEDKIRVDTDYYKKLYLPNGWHYSAKMILAYEEQFVGAATLYRNMSRENFHRDDIMLLDMLKDHLAFRLYKESNEGFKKPAADIGAFSQKYLLTRREETVLRKLWDGEDNRTISEELVISVNTLKKHILNIYRKTGVNSKSQLMNKIAERSTLCSEKE